jgi:hypothetical protein
VGFLRLLIGGSFLRAGFLSIGGSLLRASCCLVGVLPFLIVGRVVRFCIRLRALCGSLWLCFGRGDRFPACGGSVCCGSFLRALFGCVGFCIFLHSFPCCFGFLFAVVKCCKRFP